LAILESGETRTDLPCSVRPSQSVLGFDLKFHSGYEVAVPLKDLAGHENLLTILFRVTPDATPDAPYYFVQKIKVPTIQEDAKGDAVLAGFFDLGEGNYKVNWLMRDRAERVCAFNWNVEAVLAVRDKQMALSLAPGKIEQAQTEFFTEEPPVSRAEQQEPLNVKVLVNFAPSNRSAAQMRPVETLALVSILRSIAREPRIGKFSVVAFNVQEQRVVYRQESSDRIDFPALGEALEGIKHGTVDAAKLAQKNGETEFLAGLIQQELKAEEATDAFIFAGPKVYLNESVPESALNALQRIETPLFYLNYTLNPQATPWRDSIGQAVKHFHGTEFTISRPRDLWTSTGEIVSRIVKSKQTRRAAAGGSR
jgi:hypothetical protein